MGDAVDRLEVALAASIRVKGHVRKDKHGHRVHVNAYFRSPRSYSDHDLVDVYTALLKATSPDRAERLRIKHQRRALLNEMRRRALFELARKIQNLIPSAESAVNYVTGMYPQPIPIPVVGMSQEEIDLINELVALANEEEQ